ncbi:MAG: hypothetical protein NC039_04430 [Muribaculaceae bacterium]|nr:hypothetical protein [Muribaculaceae bacterium]
MTRRPLLPILTLLLLWLPAMVASRPAPQQPTHAPRERLRPSIPHADRHQPGKVFIEYADRLMTDQRRDSDVQILVGNVQIRKGDMFMYCDSARYNEKTSSLEAYDNVRMEQGDTLFVYGDMLFYDGATEIAELQAYDGRDARLINRDVSLTTPVVFYDMAEDVGYYTVGGTLTDKTNTLTSRQGYYYPSTKDSYFYLDVDLTGPREGDTLRMFTDSLAYNTDTGIAELLCHTLILSKDGEITSTSGLYYTRTGVADLFDRSTVHTWRGNTLTGDTLYYDRNSGFGEAFGHMVLTDSAGKSSIIGDYGFYDEIRDSAFVTGNALALEYSRTDTLYLHADTITAKMYSDSSRVTDAFRRVRFFRRDVQGLCDSMSMVERDSILYMYYNPIIWNGDKQVVGNVVYVHFTDSTADWARLPEAGLVSQHIGEDCYNQFSGSDMTVWMTDTVIDRLYAEGNIQVIMFPMENDSTYNKFSFTESSYLDAYFEDNDVKHLVMWPQTSGKVTPLYLARRSSYFLPKFRWYGMLRPLSPDDIFYYPPEMADLYGQNILGKMRKDALKVRGQALGRPKPPALPPAVPDSIPTGLIDLTVPTDSMALPVDSIAMPIDSIAIPLDSIPPIHPDSIPLNPQLP